MTDTQVYRIKPELEKYYVTAEYTRKIGKWPDEQYYTVIKPLYVGKFLNEHPEYTNKIRTIILDPARAGIAPKTLKKIINLNAERLVYVSCNPATQARDTEQLMQAGYTIKKFSLVDQFPHTAHIETVVLFEKA